MPCWNSSAATKYIVYSVPCWNSLAATKDTEDTAEGVAAATTAAATTKKAAKAATATQAPDDASDHAPDRLDKCPNERDHSRHLQHTLLMSGKHHAHGIRDRDLGYCVAQHAAPRQQKVVLCSFDHQ
jgi:hypothetical protein